MGECCQTTSFQQVRLGDDQNIFNAEI